MPRLVAYPVASRNPVAAGAIAVIATAAYLTAMIDPQPPLRVAIIPVTPFQQNCSLLWCTNTMRGAFVDPGGDLPKLKAAMQEHGVTIEKLILTHGHIDHAGQAKPLADELGVTIEGPHRDDEWLLEALGDATHSFGLTGVPFTPDRWLVEGDTVSVGELVLDTYETPGHTPGHVIFHHPPSNLALVGDVLFQGSVGRTDFPRSDHQALIRSIVGKLWPLGGETAFIPGHGPPSTFAHERQHNMFVSDAALAA